MDCSQAFKNNGEGGGLESLGLTYCKGNKRKPDVKVESVDSTPPPSADTSAVSAPAPKRPKKENVPKPPAAPVAPAVPLSPPEPSIAFVLTPMFFSLSFSLLSSL